MCNMIPTNKKDIHIENMEENITIIITLLSYIYYAFDMYYFTCIGTPERKHMESLVSYCLEKKLNFFQAKVAWKKWVQLF